VKQADKNRFLILLGKKVLELRNVKKISQEELAYSTDISISSISKLERGQLNLSALNIYKLSIALKVEPKELLNFSI